MGTGSAVRRIKSNLLTARWSSYALEFLSDFIAGGCLISEMQHRTDAQLLREYAENGSEPAFAELVARHAGMVYAAALRQVESPDTARDVAQSVFTDLARK